MHFRARCAGLVACALLFGAAACRRDEITLVRVPKGRPAQEPAATTAGAEASPSSPPAGHTLAWTLPDGWKQTAGSGMRFATLVPPASGRIDVSVVVLPGPAGGEQANVNRWRGQIGLPPLDELALASARKAVATGAGSLSLYDFSDEPGARRTVAGLLVSGGSSWFVKMTGDAEPVRATLPDFMRLLRALRFE